MRSKVKILGISGKDAAVTNCWSLQRKLQVLKLEAIPRIAGMLILITVIGFAISCGGGNGCGDCGVCEDCDPDCEHDFDWQETRTGIEIETCQNAACEETRGDIRLTLALGDTGPAGGKIIYIAPSGFTMTDDGSTAYYLEAAPENMPTALRWTTLTREEYETSGYDDSLWIDIPGTERAIGTGRKNTALILALDPTAPAALACDNYSIADFNDWFLPSRDELNQLYLRRADFGLSSGWFWSSSQDDFFFAWYQGFDDGYQDVFVKYYDFFVRAVRAF